MADNKRHHVIEPHVSTNEHWRDGKLWKFVRRKVPILKWFKNYKTEFILSDLMAGFTVWLTAIPASMGDAAVAGVSPEYGLYTAYLGTFIYTFLGSCRELIIGPQAVISLLSFQVCGVNYPDCVILLAFYSGAVHLILGILHLGFLVSFISEPVTVGFTAGAAILIASGQIKNFLGISGSSSGTNVVTIWTKIGQDFNTIRLGDSILGISCVLVLVIFFKLKDLKQLRRWRKYLHLLSLARNAIIMIVGMILGYTLAGSDDQDLDDSPIIITGNIKGGFPPLAPPSFRLVDPSERALNSTAVPMSETETLAYFNTSPFIIAFIAILQNVAISKKFSDGEQKVDATQEMISLGVINLLGAGIFDTIPASASFSRSAVNASSGVKSHFSGFISGVLMVISVAFIAPLFKYIPKASLASIIIAAMIFMIDFGTMWRLWKFSKLDLLTCLLTLVISVLLGMDYGILIGVGTSILIIMLKSLRPNIKTEYRHHVSSHLNYVYLSMDQGINFPSVDWVRDQIVKKSMATPKAAKQDVEEREVRGQVVDESLSFPVVVLECSFWTKWDYTSINSIVLLVDLLSKSGKILIFYSPPPKWPQLLSKFGLENPIVCQDDDQLDSVLLELGTFFIGPHKKVDNVNGGINVNGNDFDENGNQVTGHRLRSRRTGNGVRGQIDSSNFNYVRKKYSIDVID